LTSNNADNGQQKDQQSESVADLGSTDNQREDQRQEEQTEEVLRAEIESLNQQVTDAHEQAVRAQAEMQNIRRRAEQDVEKAHKFALERFATDLLEVVDNLERAIAALGDNDKATSQNALHEGVELTLKSLMDTLGKYGVEVVDPLGEPFNPDLHQAISMTPHPDMESNTVLEVMQKGYTLNKRLLRAAMVVVVQ
jgi:molecular chaperone GrpE